MADGRLIYVVGPTGAGKDAIIARSYRKLCKVNYLYFAPRYVTRVDSNTCLELSITPTAFEYYRRHGYFALSWAAHGIRYAVGMTIDRQLRLGKTVVVNGSRAYLNTALAQYPQITAVQFAVASAIARARLLARAREDADAIAGRLERAAPPVAHAGQLHTIDNNGSLDEAVHTFEQVLTSVGGFQEPGVARVARVP